MAFETPKEFRKVSKRVDKFRKWLVQKIEEFIKEETKLQPSFECIDGLISPMWNVKTLGMTKLCDRLSQKMMDILCSQLEEKYENNLPYYWCLCYVNRGKEYEFQIRPLAKIANKIYRK